MPALFIKFGNLLRFIILTLACFPPVSVVVCLGWVEKIGELILDLQFLIHLPLFGIENARYCLLGAHSLQFPLGLIKASSLGQIYLFLLVQLSGYPHLASFSHLKEIIYFFFSTLLRLSGKRAASFFIVWNHIIDLVKVMFELFERLFCFGQSLHDLAEEGERKGHLHAGKGELLQFFDERGGCAARVFKAYGSDECFQCFCFSCGHNEMLVFEGILLLEQNFLMGMGSIYKKQFGIHI